MTLEQFVKEVVNLYAKKHKAKRIKAGTIERGQSGTISSDLEDLYAKFLEANLNKNGKKHKFYVNCALKPEKGKSFRPDIAVVCNDKLCKLVEVKTDIGYHRNNFEEDLKERKNQIINLKKAKQNICDIRHHSGGKLKISKDLKCDFVVLSSKNMNPKRYKDITTKAKEITKGIPLKLFFISGNAHPGNVAKGKGTIEDIKVNKEISRELLAL